MTPTNYIPRTIGREQNLMLNAISTAEEVVMSMSSHGAPGPDGMSGKFYHSCWEIIKIDVLLLILDFSFA